jgi:membrane-associated phospholipid phosphatase
LSEEENIQQPEINTQPKFLQFLAKVVTYLCHPVFMPLVMAYVLTKLSVSFRDIPEKPLGLWLLSIGITAVFFPLFSILLMKPLGFISSYHLPTPKDRIIPLIATMTFYFWVTHVFNNMPGTPVPLVLKVLLLGNFWGVILAFMANIFTKVSLHTAGAGAMVGIMAVLLIVNPINVVLPFMIAVIIAGIIGTARLILKAHLPGDIWLGYIIGILVQFLAYWYMK